MASTRIAQLVSCSARRPTVLSDATSEHCPPSPTLAPEMHTQGAHGGLGGKGAPRPALRTPKRPPTYHPCPALKC
jgi:hypothetical protein